MRRVCVDRERRFIQFRQFLTGRVIEQVPVDSLKAVSALYCAGRRTHWYALTIFCAGSDKPLHAAKFSNRDDAVDAAKELSDLTSLPYAPGNTKGSGKAPVKTGME